MLPPLVTRVRGHMEAEMDETGRTIAFVLMTLDVWVLGGYRLPKGPWTRGCY
ncbi:hypothetical protein ACRRTK_008169 [Alexandromys fortis]